MKNTLLSLLAHDLEAGGCATQFKNARTLEVYGVDLAEHYLFTLTSSPETAVDMLFVPAVGRQAVLKSPRQAQRVTR